MDTAKLFEHVNDSHVFEFPFGCEIELPVICGVQLTKFMVIETLVALIMLLLFIPLARKIKTGQPIRGRFSNLLEVFLLFLRDDVVRPSIGHGADKFLPLIWTTLFFILGMNLFGMLPGFGSPTASYSVTCVMAVFALVSLIIAGSVAQGPIGFWVHQVPSMSLPFGLGFILKPMLFVIEVFGLMVKHFVLMVRLFANMFAGHLVLAVFTTFITVITSSWLLWVCVSAPSMALAIAISLLEIFVAFLQAYIFVFLMSLFIGMGRHAH